jgi:Mg2+ and Co2+ transporter CorA
LTIDYLIVIVNAYIYVIDRVPLSAEILSSHEEVEDLLELYLLDYSSLETEVSQLHSKIRSVEALVLMRLDTQRNELLTANTCLTILSCAVAFGAYFTGVFGMNLDNTELIQPVKGVFTTVFSSSFLIIFVLFFAMLAYFELTGVIKIQHRRNYIVVIVVIVFYILFIPLYLFNK